MPGVPAALGVFAAIAVVAVLVVAAPRAAPLPPMSSKSALPVANVPATSTRQPETAVPTPTAIAEGSFARPPRVLTCGHIRPVGGSTTTERLSVSVVDATEKIRNCTVWLTLLSGVPFVVENENESNELLGFSWRGSACDRSAKLTFDQAGTQYTLAGLREPGGCDTAAAYHASLALTIPIPAASVDASMEESTPMPATPIPAPNAVPAVEIECPSEAQPPPGRGIRLLDHSGLALTCEAFVETVAPMEPVSATNVNTDEQQLEVRWESPAACDPPVEVELWGPMVYELPFARGPEFVVQIAQLPGFGSPEGCHPGVATLGVRIGLKSPVPADRATLEVFRTTNGVGRDVDAVDGHSLQLTLTSTNAEYQAGEPIEISASLLYSGPRQAISMSGLSGPPLFGFHQLDGDVRQTDGSGWTCQDLELERDVPSTFPYRKSGVFIPENFPDPDAEAAYWSDPELRLPPGIYRLFASAGGVIDGFCMGGDGDQSTLSVRASIIIEVR
jgi:hypothetical protein